MLYICKLCTFFSTHRWNHLHYCFFFSYFCKFNNFFKTSNPSTNEFWESYEIFKHVSTISYFKPRENENIFVNCSFILSFIYSVKVCHSLSFLTRGKRNWVRGEKNILEWRKKKKGKENSVWYEMECR